MANISRLEALKTEHATYQSVDAGNASEASRNKMLSNFLAPPLLTLKVDAQVRRHLPMTVLVLIQMH